MVSIQQQRMTDSNDFFQNCIKVDEFETFSISFGVTLVVFLYLFVKKVIESFRIFQGLDFFLCFEAKMRKGKDGKRVCI